jgi:hypothetical protein
MVLLLAVSAFGFAPAPLPKHKSPTSAAEVRQGLEGTWDIEGHTRDGVLQGGPEPKWQTVRIERGYWSQSSIPKETNKLTWTTPYLITVHAKDASRVDMAYSPGDKPLLYGILKLDRDRLVVTHATSGPLPTSHTAPLRNGQERWVLRRVRPPR